MFSAEALRLVAAVPVFRPTKLSALRQEPSNWVERSLWKKSNTCGLMRLRPLPEPNGASALQ
jgi:hypothetical protein